MKGRGVRGCDGGGGGGRGRRGGEEEEEEGASEREFWADGEVEFERLAAAVLWKLSVLRANYEAKAKAHIGPRDPALASLFLMNNIHYVARKVLHLNHNLKMPLILKYITRPVQLLPAYRGMTLTWCVCWVTCFPAVLCSEFGS